MKDRNSLHYLPLIFLLFLLSSCSIVEGLATAPTATAEIATAVPPTATTTPLSEPVIGLASVESLEIVKQESFPVQVDARITGILNNDCTSINNVVAELEGNTFTIAVTTLQEPGSACGDVVIPFEQSLPLNVDGLEAGTYTVSVNNIEGSFKLDVDNQLPEKTAEESEMEETAVPTVEPTATIAAQSYVVGGRIWHDLCIGGSGVAGEAADGCILTEDGILTADGILENEPGIEGVRVSLGQGSCPSSNVLVMATTDADGAYSFGNLEAAEYCVFVDNGDGQNQDILLPGSWTAPAADIAEVTVLADEDDSNQKVNFGWDYELLPIDLTTCSNSFEFVEDLNVPDDSVFAPGEAFAKRWRLRNNGTCPWSTDYAILFVGGDLMGAEESIPLTVPVAVSETLDVEVTMIAPDEPGTYRGNWQVADPAGEPFGIDGNVEDAFWLSIVVDEESIPGATPLPDSGAIGGVVWDDFCINSDPGRGCLESGTAGVFIADGLFDALEPGLSTITISLAENACPADGTLPQADVVDTAVTGEDGLYLFQGLSEGTYCIFMDALSAENVDFLIPGNWTWPATGVGQYSFILDPGEQALDLDFGWDFVD